MESNMNTFNTFMNKMRPIDLLAIIVIVGSFILIGMGHDGVISSILMAIVGFYFGFKTTPPKE